MAEIFTLAGLVSVGLVGVTRWLEERSASRRR